MYSCAGFTGKVCKDCVSCMGNLAYNGATIPSVIGSCNGSQACFVAGFEGTVVSMYTSCICITSCNVIVSQCGCGASPQEGYDALQFAHPTPWLGRRTFRNLLLDLHVHDRNKQRRARRQVIQFLLGGNGPYGWKLHQVVNFSSSMSLMFFLIVVMGSSLMIQTQPVKLQWLNMLCWIQGV